MARRLDIVHVHLDQHMALETERTMIYVLGLIAVVLAVLDVALVYRLRHEYDIKLSYQIFGWQKTHYWPAR
jgi:hypothetical protein